VESAWLASLAAAAGGVFAWWAAPFVVSRINPPDNPVRLSLPADWRLMAFGMALTAVVTLLFGLGPALRASSVQPASALKGGSDPHSRRRLMHVLIGVQVAFCFLVLFVAGLFAATFDRLSHRPIGFSPERLLALETVAQQAEAPVYWEQVADHLRSVPGVESVAVTGWALLTPHGWNGFVSVNGAPPGSTLAFFLKVSPGWLQTMKIPLLEGTDFRATDTSPGVALVNETFAKDFFHGESPIGKSIAKDTRLRYRVVGVVKDAPYSDMRGAIAPAVYVPFRGLNSQDGPLLEREATFMVRTVGADPMAIAAALRREVPRARPEFRVSNVRSQAELVRAQTVRERLLALLAAFFAVVALLLAGIGLYGVLDYSVLQRRREIGIRMAIGAQPADIARRLTREVARMVIAGALAGVALGMVAVRYIEALLYQVKPGDPVMLAVPLLTILVAGLLAALPAVIRAVRIDPATSLRSE
jgi:predicted permease